MSVKKLPKVVDLLSRKNNLSPSRIAREIRSDRRTVEKVLKAGMDTHIIKCDRVKIGNKTYSACGLDPSYAKLYRRKTFPTRGK